MKFKYFLLISPILSFIFFEILFFFSRIYLLLIFITDLLIINAILLFILIGEQIGNFWPIIIQGILLVLGNSLFLLLLSQTIFYHLFLIIFNFLYWLFLDTIYNLLYRPRLYQPYSLEKISYWLTFINLFCFAAELNALPIFYNLLFQLTLLPFFILCFWFYFYLLRINKLEIWSKLETILIFSLILTEFYFVFNLLPLNFHLTGLILASLYVIILKVWLFKKRSMLPIVTNRQKK